MKDLSFSAKTANTPLTNPSIFTGALSSDSLGVLIAVGLIVHKIPEGLVLSLPYYYVTGSEWMGTFMKHYVLDLCNSAW